MQSTTYPESLGWLFIPFICKQSTITNWMARISELVFVLFICKQSTMMSVVYIIHLQAINNHQSSFCKLFIPFICKQSTIHLVSKRSAVCCLYHSFASNQQQIANIIYHTECCLYHSFASNQQHTGDTQHTGDSCLYHSFASNQ